MERGGVSGCSTKRLEEASRWERCRRIYCCMASVIMTLSPSVISQYMFVWISSLHLYSLLQQSDRSARVSRTTHEGVTDEVPPLW